MLRVTCIAISAKNSCNRHAELVSASYNVKIPKQVRNDIMTVFRISGVNCDINPNNFTLRITHPASHLLHQQFQYFQGQILCAELSLHDEHRFCQQDSLF